MDGVKTYVFVVVFAVVTGKRILVCVILMFFHMSTAPWYFVNSFSYLWTVATNYHLQRGRVYSEAELCVQHKLHGQKKCCLGWAPAGKHLCLPRLLHGDALHLQCNCCKHRLLHVHVWNPGGRTRGSPGGGKWSRNIRVCSRWICFFMCARIEEKCDSLN